MTLIIAHRDGWMVADRRTTFQESLIGPYRVDKIKRGPGLLVASAGNGVFGDLVAEALVGTVTTQNALDAVVRVFRDKGSDIGGHALALTRDGLCEVTSRGGVVWLTSNYWAIGSGYPFAIGYLCGIGPIAGGTPEVTPEHAKCAINLAERFVNDVGDGYQLERLE